MYLRLQSYFSAQFLTLIIELLRFTSFIQCAVDSDTERLNMLKNDLYSTTGCLLELIGNPSGLEGMLRSGISFRLGQEESSVVELSA